VSALVGWLLVIVIRAYQWLLSPWLAPACRFQPTCSHYAIEAVQRYGPLRGSWLAAKRLTRCHPLGDYGYDPLP
jgi:putative membrane protein insertion efficiency factor